MHPRFELAYHKILITNGLICDRTYHKVLLYMANEFPRFDLSQCLSTTYHDIRNIIGDKSKKDMFVQDWVIIVASFM